MAHGGSLGPDNALSGKAIQVWTSPWLQVAAQAPHSSLILIALVIPVSPLSTARTALLLSLSLLSTPLFPTHICSS